MFGRRRKLRDEEESLVPHGLIWQATDEDATEASPLDMPANQPVASNPLEMPVRRSEPEPQVESPAVPVQPPLGWPRANGEEVVRRAQAIDTAVSFPYRKSVAPATNAPAAQQSAVTPIKPAPVRPLDQQRDDEDQDLETWSAPVEPAEKTPARFSLPSWPKLKVVYSTSGPARRFGAKLQHELLLTLLQVRMLWTRAQSSASAWFAEAGRSTKAHVRAVDIKKPVASVREFSVKQARHLDSSSTQLRQGFAEGSSKLLKATAEWSAHLRQSAGAARRKLQNASRNLSQLTGRIWRFEVKIRIRGIAWPKFVGVRQSVAPRINLLRSTVRKDERLWTSLGMAGASAVLALVVITGLRHYGSVNAGSETQSPTHAATRAQQFPAPKNASGFAASEHSAPVAKSAVQPASSQNANAGVSAKKPANAERHTTHRTNLDEDYVAQDTYKYYGPTGKPSR